MQVSVEKKSDIERVIKVTVPTDTVAQAVQRRYQQLSKTAKVPGFRPGKAPIARLQQLYGESVNREVTADLMRDHYVEAIKQENVNACGYPSFDLPAWHEGKPLAFTATVQVYPEVALQSCKGCQVTRPVAEVTDKDVDDMIEKVREQHKTWVAVERAAQEGDQVRMDFVGKKDDVAFEGGTAKDAQLVLGSKQFIDGFEQGLEGLKAGDQTTLSLTFPESYHQKDLAGQPVTFDVTVHEVQAPELPPINDDLAKTLKVKEGTLDALRDHLRQHMTRELTQRVRQEVKQQVMHALEVGHDFEVPSALVEQECQSMQKHMQARMAQQFGGKDLPALPLEHFEQEAQKRVKLGLIMTAYADAHKKEVSEEETDTFLNELVAPYEDPEQMLAWYRGNDQKMSEVRAMIMEQALVDWVLATAKVTEKAMSYQEAVAWHHDAEKDSETAS